jgi:hypothetical protein
MKLPAPEALDDFPATLDMGDNHTDQVAQEDDPEASWDRAAAVQRLVERTQELRTLYGRIGYFPELEAASTQLLRELKGLVRAEITDFGAFGAALKEACNRLWQGEIGHGMRAPAGPACPYHDGSAQDALLHAILQAGDNQQAVLTLLNRDPVHETLPFIERLPFFRDGRITWRTPMRHAIIRKRPLDMTRFVQLLSELETLVNASPIRRHEHLCREVLEAIARLRRALDAEDGYIPTSLLTLERKLMACVRHPPSPKGRARLEQLQRLLGELLTIRHRYRLDGTSCRSIHRQRFATCKQMLLCEAKSYLESPWMQTPWLTSFILTSLLETELAARPEAPTTDESILTGGLRLIHEEVASGRYDCHETVRRLRQLEATGLYVHSFIYTLLRHHKPCSSLRAKTIAPHRSSS